MTRIATAPLVTLGVGCHRGADPAQALALVHAALNEAGVTAAAGTVVASIDLKAAEPALAAVAAALGAPLRFFPAARLEAETPRLASPSAAVYRAVGCHGVAEAAALAAAGQGGRLVLPKRRSGGVTCAIARGLTATAAVS